MRFVLLAWLLMMGTAQAATVTLTVIGNPSTGPWGVQGTVADARDVMADILLDSVYYKTEHTAPYSFKDDTNGVLVKDVFGAGPHTVEFIFKLEGTTMEIGRASMVVLEGQPQPRPGKVMNVGLTVQTLETVQVGWTANTEADLAGYKIYVGTASRKYDPPTVIPASRLTATASGLRSQTTYYFAVRAYDRSGNESPYSAEVAKTIP